MFFTILRHGWLSFVRAHYFRRSLGTKILIGFVVASLLYYMYLAGKQLPFILQSIQPDKDPLQVFFSFLIFLYGFDFMIRFMGQKIPRQHITAYLHLPVKKRDLALYTLIRSWFSLYNVYLFTLLIPFFRHTIPAGNMLAFYYLLAGCFMLGMLNHIAALLLKLLQQKTRIPPVQLSLIIVLVFFVGWVFSGHITQLSTHLALAFMEGQNWVFLMLILLIIAGHLAAPRMLMHSFYDAGGFQAPEAVGRKGFLEKVMGRVPVYGPFWQLEWKLIMRSKRARQNLYQMPLMPLIMFYMLYQSGDNIAPMAPFLLLITGSYGIFHLQYVYSWESRFFDFIATSNMDMLTFIRSKYYFYVVIALIQFLLLSPAILIFLPGLFPFLLGLFFYVCGAVFCYLLVTGLGNSTRIDPNKSAFFNYEGTSGKLFISILIIFLSTIPLYIGGSLLPMDTDTGYALLSGTTGLIFMATSNSWTKHIVKKYAQYKHRHLSKYREK